MGTEAVMLVLSVFLGIAQILLAAFFATKTYGVQWNLSSREGKVQPLTGVAARTSRASENFKETFPFYAAFVLLLLVLGKTNSTTAVAAQVYFYARLIYLPIYALGITHVRTLVWGASLGGIVVLGIALVQSLFVP